MFRTEKAGIELMLLGSQKVNNKTIEHETACGYTIVPPLEELRVPKGVSEPSNLQHP